MITIVAGTNRPNSYSLSVAKFYQKQIKKAGANAQILSLEALPPTLIATDLYGKRSAAFEPIQKTVSETAKFLFVVPEYNGSFPGVLKTFIDACTYPVSFYGKKAALVGVSSGKYGNIRGIEHFTGVCHYINLHVMPFKIHISYILSELDEQGDFYKPDTLKFINQQVEQFIVY